MSKQIYGDPVSSTGSYSAEPSSVGSSLSSGTNKIFKKNEEKMDPLYRVLSKDYSDDEIMEEWLKNI